MHDLEQEISKIRDDADRCVDRRRHRDLDRLINDLERAARDAADFDTHLLLRDIATRLSTIRDAPEEEPIIPRHAFDRVRSLVVDLRADRQRWFG